MKTVTEFGNAVRSCVIVDGREREVKTGMYSMRWEMLCTKVTLTRLPGQR